MSLTNGIEIILTEPREKGKYELAFRYIETLTGRMLTSLQADIITALIEQELNKSE